MRISSLLISMFALPAGSADAAPLATPGEVAAILGSAAMTEDFETYVVAPNTSASLDAASVVAPPFPCTEQGILDAIAAGGGPHTFGCVGPTVISTNAEILIGNDVVLDGEGNLTLDGGGTHRVIRVGVGVTAGLTGMTITGGNSQSSFGADFGGGIYSSGTLTITNSSITGNTAPRSGGAINNNGNLTLSNSDVSSNVGGNGGGIYTGNSKVLSVSGSTFSGNSALFVSGVSNGRGGAILSDSSSITTITNSTLSDNAADNDSNELRVDGAVLLVNSTISNSGAGAAAQDVYVAANASFDLDNTLLAANCQTLGSVSSNGGNLESPGSTCGLDAMADQVNVTAQALNLGPLQDNGGPTRTHALLAGSVAIDMALLAECPAFDQRGVARPQDGDGDMQADCDIGAFELVPLPAALALQFAALGVLGGLRRAARRSRRGARAMR